MNLKKINNDNNIIKLIELIKYFYIDELDLNIYLNYNTSFKDYFINIINDSDLIEVEQIKEIFLNNKNLMLLLKWKSYANYKYYKKELKELKEIIINDLDFNLYNEMLRILNIFIFEDYNDGFDLNYYI